ncbi:membrane protein [Clostridiales bacterium PH28_bin88]|nr:membrane protein [Clostridiales bacterium PH28_bin88]
MTSSENRVVKAAGLIMAAMFTSRILGYLRDVVIYARFGQNRITDAYNAAFSIPDFLYMLLVGGALSSAFIPTFSAYVATHREEEAWEVASIVFNVIMLLMLVGMAIGLIFTPQLVYLLVPGFDAESAGLTITLTRIMFAQVFFMALSGISMGILNSYKHFLTPAIGSVLYNLGIIVVGLILSPRYGIAGFSIGVVAGAAANIGVQLPTLLRRGLRYRLSFNVRHPGVVKIGRLMLPVLIGLSVIHFNVFVNQNLASTLSDGAVAALRTGQRLMMLPVGIFAIAVAVAVFPSLSGQAARGEMDQFRRSVSLGLRSVLFINLPAAAGLIALAVPVVRLLYEQGKFTSSATQATANALFFYSLGLFAYASIQLLNRVFYALQDTRTPVTAGIATIALNIALNYALIRPMEQGGLALAYSVAGVFNMALLLYILRRKLGSVDGARIASSFGKSLFASVLMGIMSYAVATYAANWLDLSRKLHQAGQVGAGIVVGMAVYSALAMAFKMEEAEMVWGLVTKRFRRGKQIRAFCDD